jgi:pimeloyl-ACP methyl ester carboxylesterase
VSAQALKARNGAVEIAYEIRGERGPTVLFIHGLAYSRIGWGPGPDLLAQDFRVVVFDNRGVGESDAPPGPYSVPLMVGDAIAVLDAAGAERVHVVGVSLGGYIAQELAVTHPERVEKLVLVSTAVAAAEGALPMPQRGIDGFMRFPTLSRDEGLRMLVENSLGEHGVRERPELVEEIYRYRLQHAPPLEAWQAQLAAGMGFLHTSKPIEQIAAPTLILHGGDDVIVDVRNAEVLAARIPDARVETFPDRGHLMMWQEPEWFAEKVREFLC